MQIDSTVMLPGWRPAYEAVWSLLPETREHITHARSCITPAALLHHAELAGGAVQSGVIPRWEEHDWGRPHIVVFIWPEGRRISVFHHEGTFAHIDCHEHVA